MSGHTHWTTVQDDCQVRAERDPRGPAEFNIEFLRPGVEKIGQLFLSRGIAEELWNLLDDLLSEGPDDGTDAAVDRIREVGA